MFLSSQSSFDFWTNIPKMSVDRAMRVFLLLLLFSFEGLQSFDVDEYLASIDQWTVDESFFDEYTQRSLKLFSHSDYLYGNSSDHFPCDVPPQPMINQTRSVHRLRPSDIQCVGALGDSLTAALGAHAITPAGLIVENRGSSWSIGGDYRFTRMISLPNILREYNPQLKGYSEKSTIIFLQGQNGSRNGLNVGRVHLLISAHSHFLFFFIGSQVR